MSLNARLLLLVVATVSCVSCAPLNSTAECDADGQHFECGDGVCVPLDWLCDGHADCAGDEDENNAICQPLGAKPGFERGTCPPLHFECPTAGDETRCVPETFHCDGHVDCANGADELDCAVEPRSPMLRRPQQPIGGASNVVTECSVDEFRCTTIAVACIPMTMRCNGRHDCRDSSDEEGCDQHSTSLLRLSQTTSANPPHSTPPAARAHLHPAFSATSRIQSNTPNVLVKIAAIVDTDQDRDRGSTRAATVHFGDNKPRRMSPSPTPVTSTQH